MRRTAKHQQSMMPSSQLRRLVPHVATVWCPSALRGAVVLCHQLRASHAPSPPSTLPASDAGASTQPPSADAKRADAVDPPTFFFAPRKSRGWGEDATWACAECAYVNFCNDRWCYECGVAKVPTAAAPATGCGAGNSGVPNAQMEATTNSTIASTAVKIPSAPLAEDEMLRKDVRPSKGAAGGGRGRYGGGGNSSYGRGGRGHGAGNGSYIGRAAAAPPTPQQAVRVPSTAYAQAATTRSAPNGWQQPASLPQAPAPTSVPQQSAVAPVVPASQQASQRQPPPPAAAAAAPPVPKKTPIAIKIVKVDRKQ